jgi:hypothetical protein
VYREEISEELHDFPGDITMHHGGSPPMLPRSPFITRKSPYKTSNTFLNGRPKDSLGNLSSDMDFKLQSESRLASNHHLPAVGEGSNKNIVKDLLIKKSNFFKGMAAREGNPGGHRPMQLQPVPASMKKSPTPSTLNKSSSRNRTYMPIMQRANHAHTDLGRRGEGRYQQGRG